MVECQKRNSRSKKVLLRFNLAQLLVLLDCALLLWEPAWHPGPDHLLCRNSALHCPCSVSPGRTVSGLDCCHPLVERLAIDTGGDSGGGRPGFDVSRETPALTSRRVAA